MKYDPCKLGTGDLDNAIAAFDAGAIGKEQLALDARIYSARRARPKYDAMFKARGL